MSKSRPPRKREIFRSAVFKITFAIFVLASLLIALEIVLRTTHVLGARISWSQPDETLAYRYTPGAHYWYLKENDHPITGKINRFGWRDSDWQLQKPKGTFRIAVLGDSYVEAFQVESESTFQKIAETRLNDSSNCNIEFLNFGRSGFTQTEELIIIEEVLAFSPDVVLLFFLPANDIADIHPETTLRGHGPYLTKSDLGNWQIDTSFSREGTFRLKKRINWLKQRSALLSFAAERYIHFLTQRSFREHAPYGGHQSISGYLSLCTASPDKQYKTSYEINKAVIQSISATLKNENVDLFLVCIDDAYIPEVEHYLKRIDKSFDAFFFESDLRNFSASLNIGFIGLQTAFRDDFHSSKTALHFGTWNPETLLVNGGHWNYRGHKVVSDAVNDHIARLLMTKRGCSSPDDLLPPPGSSASEHSHLLAQN